MKILLDENFPLPLYHRLREEGYDAEHVIVLGQRGIPDSVLRQRLAREELVFLTNDTEFEQLSGDCRRCRRREQRESDGGAFHRRAPALVR